MNLSFLAVVVGSALGTGLALWLFYAIESYVQRGPGQRKAPRDDA